jgi:antitoxin component YwqK of YwqJK toxin-antitoxin module
VVSHYERGRFDGGYECYDRYGCLKEKGSFMNGKRHGIWITYDEAGSWTDASIYEKGVLCHQGVPSGEE